MREVGNENLQNSKIADFSRLSHIIRSCELLMTVEHIYASGRVSDNILPSL